MSSQCFVCIFLCVYVLQFINCLDREHRHKSPDSGPFKASIISIKDCINPSKPYLKNPQLVFLSTIIHKNTLSGNVTILKDFRNTKFKIRGFILQNGKWKSSYLLNNLDCHGLVLHLMCTSMNIKYDRTKCLYPKGSYFFENVDVNQLAHFWTSNLKYGHLLWRAETYSQSGTFICKELVTIIEPA